MREILRQLSYLFSRREKRNSAILFGMMLVGSVFEVVGVGAIPAFISVISMPERLLEMGRVRWAYDALGLASPREMVFWAAVALMAFFVFKNAYLVFLEYYRTRFSVGRQVLISNRLFRAYLHSPYSFHLQRNTADLLRNTSSEAANITTGVLLPGMAIVMETMTLALIFGLLVAIEPVVTLIAFSVLGAVVYAFYRATRATIDRYAEQEQTHRSLTTQAVNQGLGGFKDTRVLGREGFFLEAFARSAWFNARAAQYRAIVGALPRLFLETVAVAGLLGVSILLMAQDRPLDTVVPSLALLAVALVRMMPAFQKIWANVSAIQWGRRSLAVVYDDLASLEAQESAFVKQLRAGGDVSFEREIAVENLSFRYEGQAEDALADVTLTVPRNASVGFVGPSGAGKTTVVDVLLGLLTPTGGRVAVDGTDIQTCLPAWQRRIGYIPQTIFLTDDTVRNNVAFGIDPEDISDDQVWAAVDAAQLRDLVESLPAGLDTAVGERGVRLSGGQRQRIGIARALYNRPDVLVMDEATSALDTQTERQFVEALNALQGEHTVVVIAHRLSTVRHCDTLFLMERGRVTASGTYDELLETSALFRAMAGEAAETPEPVPA
jgi:ABC-type multidrug transport system fused ATPase/permease subunit